MSAPAMAAKRACAAKSGDYLQRNRSLPVYRFRIEQLRDERLNGSTKSSGCSA